MLNGQSTSNPKAYQRPKQSQGDCRDAELELRLFFTNLISFCRKFLQTHVFLQPLEMCRQVSQLTHLLG